ncbi:VOC family protein [Cognatishimia sp. MH4019]|uniref:VOC family protein n=1 Tax=Cognatishimia sp. MH4019 TaxID=2854030 RepID=UPI001CD36427|nr:VOC family protein [Cognatishimia sp. MH4019]
MLSFDHFAITTTRLEDGVAEVEEALGLSLDAGGQHPHFGTHNRLLGLGGAYMEVIAIDPDAPAPDYPRWFDMDNFDGPTRLTNWIVQTPDLAAALADLPDGVGNPVALQRGDLRWQMAVPADGKLPCDGAFPAIIAWEGDAHPAKRLAERGCRLTHLEIAHPRIAEVRAALRGHFADPLISMTEGPEKRLTAEIATPHGTRVLS